MPSATEHSPFPYSLPDAIQRRVDAMEAKDRRRDRALKWAARFGKAGAIMIAAFFFIPGPIGLLGGAGLASLGLAFLIRFAAMPVWKQIAFALLGAAISFGILVYIQLA